jgi:putative sterol carrier protein
MADFLSTEWLQGFVNKLNSDEHYAHVARDWEADMTFIIEPGGSLSEHVHVYLDLWHGKCREAYIQDGTQPARDSVFTLQAPYDNFVRVVKGELDPMQAMLTRKLKVKGNMTYMLRNVPVVLDFMRCLREATDTFA